MKFLFLYLSFLVFCSGCITESVSLEEKTKIEEKENNDFVLNLLPPNSSIIKKIVGYPDSGWYVVEIKIDEKTNKQYLLRWWYGSHGERSINLVELNNFN